MVNVSTGDRVLDRTVLALIQKCRVPESILLSVCSDSIPARPGADIVIVITDNAEYKGSARHKEYSEAYGERYHILPRPLSFSAFEEIVRGVTSSPTDSPTHNEAELSYDSALRKVRAGNSEVILTPKEAELFEYFLNNKGHYISREELRANLWSETENTNAPDVYVSYLRQKLGTVIGDGVLVNVRGKGYLLKY